MLHTMSVSKIHEYNAVFGKSPEFHTEKNLTAKCSQQMVSGERGPSHFVERVIVLDPWIGNRIL